MVLSLLVSGCMSTSYYGGGDGNIVEKNKDYIKIGVSINSDGFDSWPENRERFEKNKEIAKKHCETFGKFAFDLGNSMWRSEPHKYVCAKSPKEIALNDNKIEWTNFSMGSEMNMKNIIEEAKSYCTQLGLKPGTDKYADCSIQLLASKIESQKQIVQQVNSGMSGTVTINDPVRDSDAMIKRGQGLINGTCTLGDLSNC